MAPLILDGNTLGEKHKNYNQLLQSTLETNKKVDFTPADLNSGNNELETLMKIDIASKNKDVDFILEVLKCEDLLYVSYVLKRCVWLIKDPQYASIINPDYLRTNLIPQMTAKASSKLWKQIRLHLDDQKRAEEFYMKEDDSKKANWLPNCSPAFIEANVSKHKDLKDCLAKRICERSENAITKMKGENDFNTRHLEKASFLIDENPEVYLSLIENLKSEYNRPKFGKRSTAKLMTKFSDRIINKFEVYGTCVHFPTFIKYLNNLKNVNLEEFIYKLVDKRKNNSVLTNLLVPYENFKMLINALPKQDRFAFVNKIFLKIEHTKNDEDEHSPKYCMRQVYLAVSPFVASYKFYEFAPFEIAFAELRKLYNDEEKNKRVKKAILSTLVVCASKNLSDVVTLLKYYREKHIRDDRSLKIHFLEKIISETNFFRFDDLTWSILDGLFKDIDIYNDSERTDDFNIISSIILYKILHDTEIPDILIKKFDFKSLKLFDQYLKKFNEDEKQKLFNYFYNLKISELELQSISNEKDFEKAITILNQIMTTLFAWKKELSDYPEVIERVKAFVEVKCKNSWKTDMESLYSINKSWKKIFFEESFALNPSEDVSLNALKHNSELLLKNKNTLDDLKIPLLNVFKKLRLYWSESLSKLWMESYLSRLGETENHKIIIRGLCALLPRQPLLDMIDKNAPKQADIDWDNINETELSLQRHLAKNMHIARPQPPPQAILSYAKGDYLQYALPSLLAIFYNMKLSLTREFIPKLLSAPVSLQKHGIRLVFQKLSTDELLQSFPTMWKVSKNASIRAVLFSYTFDMLCKEKDAKKMQSIWQMMIPLMDNFTFEEDKRIYLYLDVSHVQKVPSEIRPEYFVKSYKFMRLLIPHLPKSDTQTFKYYLDRLTDHIRELIHFLPCDFVVEILSEYTEDEFIKTRISEAILKTLSAYLLFSVQNEKTQFERYNSILLPLMKRCFSMWSKKNVKENYAKINFVRLLDCLRKDLKYVVENKCIIPVQLYSNILDEMIVLPVAENYILLTKWKLTVELTKVINSNKSVADNDFQIVRQNVANEFGHVCLRILKEDIKLYFSDIYLLFAKSLEGILDDLPITAKVAVYRQLLTDVECIEAYLTLIVFYPQHIYDKEDKTAMEELKKLLLKHPSVEVKMHWYHKFKNSDDD